MTVNELILVHEPGLGDHFICNGLVNWISQKADRLFLPAYDHHIHNNLLTVQSLYANHPVIEVVPVPIFLHHWQPTHSWQDYFSSWNTPILQIHKPNIENPLWYSYFYQQVGLTWTHHQQWASIPEPTNKAQQILEWVWNTYGKQYRVIHNHSTTGTVALHTVGDDTLPTIHVTPGLSDNLLDWQLVLQYSQEIHVCLSSVFWMCNLLTNLPRQLYYHNSRPTLHPIFSEHFPKWTFVNDYKW